MPALAACLASFCESHTHPGGHFSIRVWLESRDTGATTKYTPAPPDPTHSVSPAPSVSLNTLGGPETYLRGKQGLEHVHPGDRSYPTSTLMGGPKASVAHQTPSPGTAP